MRTGHRSWLLGIAALAVATGCASAVDPTVGRSPEAAAGTSAGGELRIGITEPGDLDPTSATTPSAKLVLSALCQPLISLDPTTGLPRPGAAGRFVQGSDGQGVTVVLRRGARFSDGEKVTSKDIVEQLKRIALPTNANPNADLIADIAGYDKFRTDAEDTGSIPTTFTGVRVVAPDSAEILFARKAPELVKLLALPAFAPVSHKAYARSAVAQSARPTCYGPYVQTAPHTVGDREIVLERNPGYVEGDNAKTGGGKGYADRIVFRVHPDPDAAYAAWSAGEVDVVGVPPAKVAEVRGRPEAKTVPANHVEYLGVVVKGTKGEIPAEQQAAYRVALSQALDRTAIATDVFGGSRAPATGFVPPAVGAAYAGDRCAAQVPLKADVEAAKASLARAGGEVPRQIELTFNTDFQHDALARAVANQWKAALGIEVTPKPLVWDAYLSAAQQGLSGAFRLSWQAPYPSARGYLAPLFGSSYIGTSNLEKYSSPEFDEALARDVDVVTDAVDRDAAFGRLEKTLCTEMPLIPVAFSETTWLVRATVRSARPDGRVTTVDGLLTPLELAPAAAAR